MAKAIDADPGYSSVQTGSTAGALILCFVVLRVFAGVAENAGVPRLSEAAGMALCAALVLQFVRDWRYLHEYQHSAGSHHLSVRNL